MKAGRLDCMESPEGAEVAAVSLVRIRVMQRPELVTTRRPAAATAAELEQHGTVRGRRRQRKESEKGPSGRPIYKAKS